MAERTEPYRVPFGMAGVWVVGIITELWALFATAALLWPGFLTPKPDSSLPTGFTRVQYQVSQIVPLIVLFAPGAHFFWLGSPTRRESVDVPLEPTGTGMAPSPA